MLVLFNRLKNFRRLRFCIGYKIFGTCEKLDAGVNYASTDFSSVGRGGGGKSGHTALGGGVISLNFNLSFMKEHDGYGFEVWLKKEKNDVLICIQVLSVLFLYNSVSTTEYDDVHAAGHIQRSLISTWWWSDLSSEFQIVL